MRTIKSVDFNAFLNVSEMQIKCIWTVKKAYIGTSVFISGVQFYYSSVCLFTAFCFTVGLNVLVCNCLYYCITCFTFVVSRKRRFPPCHYPKLVNYYCFYSTLLYTVNLFEVWMNELMNSVIQKKAKGY